MNGRISVVTGATNGIGKATAIGLAERGAKVVIVARNAAKAAMVVAEIARIPGALRAEVVLADLTEMKQVVRAADEIRRRFERVDVLINNAAAMFDTHRESSEGIERTYAINHLAAFLLTLSLHEHLKKSARPRVVIVSSHLQKAVYIADYFSLVRPRYEWPQLYAQTKLRDLIFAMTLSARWKSDGISVNSLHPGVVDTGLMGGWDNRAMKVVFGVIQKFFLSPGEGARTSIFLASDPSVAEVTGRFYQGVRPHQYNPVADVPTVQDQLWAESIAQLEQAGIALPEAAIHA